MSTPMSSNQPQEPVPLPVSLTPPSEQVKSPSFTTEFQDINFLHMRFRSDVEQGRVLGRVQFDSDEKLFTRIIPPHWFREIKNIDKPAPLLSPLPSRGSTFPVKQTPSPVDNAETTQPHANPSTEMVFTSTIKRTVWNWTYALRQWSGPSLGSDPYITEGDEHSAILFIRVKEFLHTGRTWDIYRGDIMLSADTGPIVPIVLRLTCLKEFIEEIPNVLEWDPARQQVRSQALEGIINEDLHYRSYLSRLQGKLVPYYYGLFVFKEDDDQGEDEWIIASILEDVGDQIEPMAPIAGAPLKVREEIFEAVEYLHNYGYLSHNGLNQSHILERYSNDDHPPSQHITLVDFQESVGCLGKNKEKGEHLKKRELLHLSYLLSCHRNDKGQMVEQPSSNYHSPPGKTEAKMKA
ncbi:uncharacterized protein L201_006063 [Kwoniella dendrophila CBS 6074]|uniref:Protein kinase domain-containing protein n=1 Tax=Kwoniella dendrophila CBS 6074 TaxID=1295534 RepID=A0AAX4K2L4_9TREE